MVPVFKHNEREGFVSLTEHAFADFSNSESRLSRAIQIAKYCDSGPLPILAVNRRLARDFRIGNVEVARRHVKLSKCLGLISTDGGIARVSASGRALLQIDKDNKPNPLGLTIFDRGFILESLIRNAPLQVMKILEAVADEPGRPVASVVIRFLEIDGHLPWRKEQIDRALSDFRRTGKISALFEHKVSCRLHWLRQLGLVNAEGPAKLTGEGTNLLSHWIPNRETLEEEPARLTAIGLGFAPRTLTVVDAETEEVIRAIRPAVAKFTSPLGTANYEEVRVYLTLQFLCRRGIVIEGSLFNRMVNQAWRNGEVRSVLGGRRGQPSSLVPAS